MAEETAGAGVGEGAHGSARIGESTTAADIAPSRLATLRQSLRVRLLLALAGLLVAVALILGTLTYRNVLAETEALFDYQLRQMAFSLRDQGEIAPAQASSLADGDLDFVVQIWTADGRVIYPPRARADVPQRALLGLADIAVGGTTWRTFSVASRERVIQVAQPREVRRRLAAGAALRSVAPIAYLAPMLALVVWWLAAQTLAPLRRLADGLKTRDEQSLQPLPMAGLPPEVGPLVVALNGLLHRLGRSLDLQRAFVSDAAHELRSPLTALKLQLQLLRRAPDAAARAEAVDHLHAGVERAVRLVEQMLALARAEPGAARLATVPLDLVEIARAAIATTAESARARGTTLGLVAAKRDDSLPEPPQSLPPDGEASIEMPTSVPVIGDPTALTALVRNLVDNAVRYSPPGARVEVRVSTEAGGALLQVDDDGPGIPPSERERVFDRFHRHASGDETGSGLGLAIVRGIAEQHGARVTLGDSPLGGLRAEVRLPVRSPA